MKTEKLLTSEEVRKKFGKQFHWAFVLDDENSCPEELIDPEEGYVAGCWTDSIVPLGIKNDTFDARSDLLPMILISRDGTSIKFINNAEKYLGVNTIPDYIIIYAIHNEDGEIIQDVGIDLCTGCIIREYNIDNVEKAFESWYELEKEMEKAEKEF